VTHSGVFCLKARTLQGKTGAFSSDWGKRGAGGGGGSLQGGFGGKSELSDKPGEKGMEGGGSKASRHSSGVGGGKKPGERDRGSGGSERSEERFQTVGLQA